MTAITLVYSDDGVVGAMLDVPSGAKCPILKCTETGKHLHSACPACGATEYGNYFCSACRAKMRELLNEGSLLLELAKRLDSMDIWGEDIYSGQEEHAVED